MAEASSDSIQAETSSATVHILHVDDEPDFADMAATFIEREDDRFDVETATSATEGLQRLADRQFGCIVSDYDMPGQNGLEFLEAVRDEYPSLPFILFTGKGTEEIAADAISAGVTDYLRKGSGSSRYALLAQRITNAVQTARAESELQETFSRVTDAIYTLDTEWRITYINEGGQAVMGPKEELLGTNLWEEFPAAADGVIWENFHEAMETQDPTSFEVFFEPLDLWAHATAYPSRSGLTVYFQDITEQRERDEELHRAHNRFQAVFEKASDAMVIADDNGQYIDANPRAAELFGLDREDLLGRSISEFAPEDFDFESAWTQFQQSERERGTFPLVRADGERRMVEYAASSEIVEGQHLSILRDISDHREQILTALHDVGLDLAASETIDEVCQLTIDAAEHILEFDLSVIAIEEERQLAVRATSEALPEDAPRTMHVDTGLAGKTYRTGDSFLIEDQSHPDVDESEGPYQSVISLPVGGHGNFQAVAEETHAFDESDLELAELLIDRTESAIDRLLYEEELEHQNERLNEFANVVSHDLRTPVDVIQGRLILAQEGDASDHLDAMETAAGRMDQIIEDVLSLARDGRDIGLMNPIMLRDAAEDAWTLVADDADLASLQYGDDDLSKATVTADPDRFLQLLENLFGNAIQHGGEEVRVIVGTVPTGFYVEDDGPGIPEDERDDVFAPGYSTGTEGTGFGLSIVKTVVEAHNWDIHVKESGEGGARFEITGVEFVAE